MKLFLVLIFSLPAFAYSQWTWQNPLPQGNTFYSIAAIPGSASAFAVGGNGTLFFTSNAGRLWEDRSQVLGIQNLLRSVSFASSSVGYIVGDSGLILKTTDKGISWHRLISGTSFILSSVCFPALDTGYVAGYYFSPALDTLRSIILRTTNGGVNWTVQDTISGYAFASIACGNSRIACAVGSPLFGGSGIIVTTQDGGNSWSSKTVSNYSLRSTFFTDSLEGYIVGDRGLIYQTTDAGKNWQTQNSGTTATLMSVYFSDSAHGMCVTTSGILKTTNRGLKWTAYPTPVNKLNAVIVFNNDSAVAVGSDGKTLYTTNGGSQWGLTWSTISSDLLLKVLFVNSQLGYAIGGELFLAHGAILKTTNGGLTWNVLPAGVTVLLQSVFFVDSAFGVVVGDNGKIFKTTNGGSKWNSIPSGITTDCYDVCFISKSTGIIVGDAGKILKTTDSGSTWSLKNSPTQNYLLSVVFTDSLTGYCVGSAGTILKTTDGGESWLPLISGTLSTLQAIKFVSKTNAYAIGANKILHTIDAGNTWTIQSRNEELHNIYFKNQTTGYAVGGYGAILETNDGGVTWNTQISPTNNDLFGIWFVDSVNGFITGRGGTILKTTNGGVSFVDDSRKEIPSSLGLLQNYPNPFSQSTVISCQSLVGQGKFEVRDMLGRVVYQKRVEASRQEITFDGSQLRNGVYLYTISDRKNIEMKKMVIVK